jgi:hypothetical protein
MPYADPNAQRAATKIWRQKNKERVNAAARERSRKSPKKPMTEAQRASRRAYYQAHKEKVNAEAALWHREHPKETKEAAARHYQKHKEKLAVEHKIYKNAHWESVLKQARKDYGRKKEARPWKIYEQNAKQKKREWALTPEVCAEVMKRPCHYCGVRGNPYIGMDRKDNDVGYIVSNVLPACTECNAAKSNRKYEEFLSWVHRAAAHLQKSGAKE